MNNHYHLIIETPEGNLSKVMRQLNGVYTQIFNKRHKKTGHIFQGRYKAILIQKDSHLLEACRYVVLNPVRAKIVQKPEDWKWSSYHNYAKQNSKGVLIDTDPVLKMFSEDKAAARKLYRAYMGDELSIKKEDIYRTVDQRILGREEFIDKVVDKYEGKLVKEKREREHTLSEIAKGIEKLKGVSLEQLRGLGKAVNISSCRKLLSIVAKEYGYKGKEIAAYIRRDPAVVSIALKGRKQLEKDMGNVIKYLKATAQ